MNWLLSSAPYRLPFATYPLGHCHFHIFKITCSLYSSLGTAACATTFLLVCNEYSASLSLFFISFFFFFCLFFPGILHRKHVTPAEFAKCRPLSSAYHQLRQALILRFELPCSPLQKWRPSRVATWKFYFFHMRCPNITVIFSSSVHCDRLRKSNVNPVTSHPNQLETPSSTQINEESVTSFALCFLTAWRKSLATAQWQIKIQVVVSDESRAKSEVAENSFKINAEKRIVWRLHLVYVLQHIRFYKDMYSFRHYM